MCKLSSKWRAKHWFTDQNTYQMPNQYILMSKRCAKDWFTGWNIHQMPKKYILMSKRCVKHWFTGWNTHQMPKKYILMSEALVHWSKYTSNAKKVYFDERSTGSLIKIYIKCQKVYFDEQKVCKAPVHWSKYTTYLVFVFWANFSWEEIPFWKKLYLAFYFEVFLKLCAISKNKIIKLIHVHVTLCDGILYSQLSRCSTARGLFLGCPKEIPLRLRLVGLFYAMKVPLNLKMTGCSQYVCWWLKYRP